MKKAKKLKVKKPKVKEQTMFVGFIRKGDEPIVEDEKPDPPDQIEMYK